MSPRALGGLLGGLLVAALLGCDGSEGGAGAAGASGSAGGAGATGAAGGAGADACGAAAEAFCARFEGCSPFWFAVAWDAQEACQQERAASCRRERSAPGATASDAQIADCNAALTEHCSLLVVSYGHEAGLMGGLLYQPKECVWTGTLAEGKPCERDAQCERGVCRYAFGCKRCAAGAPEGESCSSITGFGEHSFSRCAPGLTCEATCVPIRYEGESCEANTACEGLLTCQGGVCAPPAFVGPSAGCSVLDGKQPGPPEAPCEVLTLAHKGEPCDPYGSTLCAAGLVCVDGACADDGDACSLDADCGAGRVCTRRRCREAAPEVCPSP